MNIQKGDEIEIGDKVEIPGGKQAEVIDYEYDRLFSAVLNTPRMKVRLDGSGETKIFYPNELTFLRRKPNLDEVDQALNKIKRKDSGLS